MYKINDFTNKLSYLIKTSNHFQFYNNLVMPVVDKIDESKDNNNIIGVETPSDPY